MLRLLLQSIEKLLGSGLGRAAAVAYWAGWVVLALALALPLYRLWMRLLELRAGVARGWSALCPECGQAGVISGSKCSRCGASLSLPWPLRLRTGGRRWLTGAWSGRLSLFYAAAGVAVFGALALWLVGATGAASPRGPLHRLFLGLALLALAGFGVAAGRALGGGPRGLLARAGEAVQALAAVGLLAIFAFLAGQARPPAERVLARFSVGDATSGTAVVRTSDGEAGIEYLQLDHETLGYHRIVPLALAGREKVPLPAGFGEKWVVQRLRKNVDRWAARGLTVRVRRDLREVTPGGRYEVVERDGQVLIRKAAAAPASAPAGR